MTDVSVAHLHHVDPCIHSYMVCRMGVEPIDRQLYGNYHKRPKVVSYQLIVYSSLTPLVYRPSRAYQLQLNQMPSIH